MKRDRDSRCHGDDEIVPVDERERSSRGHATERSESRAATKPARGHSKLSSRAVSARAPVVARASAQTLIPSWVAAAVPAYLAVCLAIDTQVGLAGQLVLGAATWLGLLAVCAVVSTERRAQAAVVVAAATTAEVVGSILWGVYRYRLHNLPLFVPPAHGLVYLGGLALSQILRRHARALVAFAATTAAAWGLAGLTLLPRLDVAGAFGVPLLLVFGWRSPARAAYAGVFVMVAALELYGTAIGTWRWAPELPGLGIPDGNPPSGVASGYVWFDVMALLLAPRLSAGLRAVRTRLPSLAAS